MIKLALATFGLLMLLGCGSAEPAPVAPVPAANTGQSGTTATPGPTAPTGAVPPGAPEGAGADGTLPEDRM